MTRRTQPQSLRQRALNEIRRGILDGRYAPNCVLSENELADEYSISRTPIREALRELAVRGLVRILPKRGIIVTELTARDVLDLYQIREPLECYAVRLATDALQSKDAEGFLSDQRTTQRHLEKGDLRQAYEWSIKMHSRIIALTHNQKLQHIMDELADQIYRIGMLTLRYGRSATSISEHSEIIDAMISGSANGAVELMREHLLSDREIVLTRILPIMSALTSEGKPGEAPSRMRAGAR